MSSPEHKAKIWNIIKEIKVGMLTTSDGNDLRSRPMQLSQEDYDGTIWLFTKLDDPKAEEVEDEHQVCLTFSDVHNDTHVSLSGAARISQDHALIDRIWNDEVSQWFEGDKNHPKMALLEIKIFKGEHWDKESNNVVQLFETLKAKITDDHPTSVEHVENQKFGS